MYHVISSNVRLKAKGGGDGDYQELRYEVKPNQTALMIIVDAANK